LSGIVGHYCCRVVVVVGHRCWSSSSVVGRRRQLLLSVIVVGCRCRLSSSVVGCRRQSLLLVIVVGCRCRLSSSVVVVGHHRRSSVIGRQLLSSHHQSSSSCHQSLSPCHQSLLVVIVSSSVVVILLSRHWLSLSHHRSSSVCCRSSSSCRRYRQPLLVIVGHCRQSLSVVGCCRVIGRHRVVVIVVRSSSSGHRCRSSVVGHQSPSSYHWSSFRHHLVVSHRRSSSSVVVVVFIGGWSSELAVICRCIGRPSSSSVIGGHRPRQWLMTAVIHGCCRSACCPNSPHRCYLLSCHDTLIRTCLESTASERIAAEDHFAPSMPPNLQAANLDRGRGVVSTELPMDHGLVGPASIAIDRNGNQVMG